MMGIHPAQIKFLKEIAEGHSILWHEAMQYLLCFDPERRDRRWIHAAWTPGLEILRAWSSDEIVGICFICFRGQLAITDELLAARDAGDNIPAISLAIHSYEWATQNDKWQPRFAKPFEEATGFLKEKQILIPHRIWMQALPRSRH